MQRCRMEHLVEIPVPEAILLAGEGHGRFLPACMRRFPEAEITIVDYSAGMLARARANLSREGLPLERVRFVHADILAWEGPEGVFDLIVTHFFLDCFTAEQVEVVVARLAAAAKLEATWLLADFRTEEAGLKGLRARWIVGLLYSFFRFFTRIPARKLISPDLALRKSGFILHHEKIREWGLLKSQWWARS